tara:strand:+ start:141 stop:371 length:231 start_codon:yes stop_codon:yes gene_type:complete
MEYMMKDASQQKMRRENTIESILENITAQYEAGLLHSTEYRRSLRTISDMVNKRLDVLADDEYKAWFRQTNPYGNL